MFATSCRSLRRFAILVLILNLAFAGFAQPAAAEDQSPAVDCLIYVNVSAPAGGDGSTWAKAYNNLQTAITSFYSRTPPCQIWVAKGTYIAQGTRLASFNLSGGLSIYGGFSGNETALGQRSWSNNKTVLSGAGSSNPQFYDYNVVYVYSNATNADALDGFTIESGNANSSSPGGPNYINGGGIYNDSGSPALVNLTVQNNSAVASGGGIYVNGGSPTLTNVTVQNNTAGQHGGGIYISNSSPVLTNVALQNNSASLDGGGINISSGSPTFSQVNFFNNSGRNGGGMFVGACSSLSMDHVFFTGNTAVTDGGGLYLGSTCPGVSLTAGLLSQNIAGRAGGGGYFNAPASLSRMNIRDNTADFGAGLIIDGVASGFSLSGGLISHNTATSRGGGLYVYGSAPALTNLAFSNNSGLMGGAISNYNSSPVLTNVSISGSSSVNPGAGIYNSGSHPLVRNSILWGDAPGEVYADASSGVSMTYSLTQGCNPGGAWNSTCGADGGHNLVDADPKFMDPANGILRLMVSSPAIDRGNNTYVSGILYDVGGGVRIFGEVVDMGAYETVYYKVYLPEVVN